MSKLMGKLEFLDALRRAMAGLAPELQAKTLAYYEQRFVDGASAGQSEEDIAKELGDPTKIAMTLRASTHLRSFEVKKSPSSVARMLFASMGLAVFNLFMLVPAIVYGALLTALFASSLVFYSAGIVITASGLSGANELVIDGPIRHHLFDDRGDFNRGKTQAKVQISEEGIRFFQEEVEPAPPEERRVVRAIERAEDVAERGIRISTTLEDDSRATQSLLGIGMVLGGILMFLLSLVLIKYTFIGLKRYIQMNYSLIRGN